MRFRCKRGSMMLKRTLFPIVFAVLFVVIELTTVNAIYEHHETQSIKRKITNDFVKKVHIVFMNHLDVGYASFINNVLNEYFEKYFALANNVSLALAAGGYVETFIYTTHPWLVSLYLDCPPNLILAGGIKLKCPTDAEKATFISAINKGFINWHAEPFNLEVEFASPWLFEASLDLSIDLDRRFNITRGMRALSLRDVPGFTQASIPSLVKKGVVAVSVGVNNACPPPQVPSLFMWQYGTDSVMATWHPGGYPDNPGPNPAHPDGLSRHDCVVVDGFPEALCFAFRTDNSGPPTSVEEILGYYEILRAEFPNAELKASRLNEFFEAAMSIKDKLPVVTNEIGDQWIQGVPSDPRKCIEYRTVSRILGHCIESGECSLRDNRVWNATRFLIKIPEHTWGLPSEHDTHNWTNAEFYKLRKTLPSFINSAASWLEQREFTYLTIDALADHTVVKDITAELDKLTPVLPDLTNYVKVSDPSQKFQCPSGNIKSLQFGPDGSIIGLNYKNIDWTSSTFNLGSFLYISYNDTDFKTLGKISYYGKENMNAEAHPESKTWPVDVITMYSKKGVECDFYVNIAVSDSKAVTFYGAPSTIWIRYIVRPASGNTIPGIDLEVQWFNKSITRLYEALFFSFRLLPQTGYKWWMSKMNQPVDPNNVVSQGSQNQHILDDIGAVFLRNSSSTISVQIRSPDVPLVSPLTATTPPRVFPYPLDPIKDEIVGMAFNFYNNVWETNYIMWYPYEDGDENFKARFTIDFIEKGQLAGV